MCFRITLSTPWLAVALLTAAATTVHAQQQEPLTYVALYEVSADKVNAFAEKAKAYVPTLDALMKSGDVTAYGVDVDIIHKTSGQNVDFWFSVPNWTSLSKALDAIDAFQKKNPLFRKELNAITDLSKHSDLIVRSVDGGSKANPGCDSPYSSFNMSKVKPGMMQEFTATFKKVRKPLLDKLLADGVICAYSLDVEELHTMAPGNTWSIIAMPSLAAMDKVDAAFTQANQMMSESERAAMRKRMQEIMEPDSHRDQVTRALLFKAK